MSEAGVKRPRDDDAAAPDGEQEEDPAGRHARKAARVEEFMESMDASVRIKLLSMFDAGLLHVSDLDDHNVEALQKFDAPVALEILESYCRGDLSAVRNRCAYLGGAIKRRAHLVKPEHQTTESAPRLHPDVRKALDDLKAVAGQAGILDGRTLDTLASLPPSVALEALSRYSTGRDFSRVRSPNSLLLAIIRGVVDSPAFAGDRGGGSGSRGGRGGSGRQHDRDSYPGREQHGPPPQQWEYPHREREGPYREGPPPPFHDRGPRPPPPPPRRDPLPQLGGPYGSMPMAGPAVAGTLAQGPNGTLIIIPAQQAGPVPGVLPSPGVVYGAPPSLQQQLHLQQPPQQPAYSIVAPQPAAAALVQPQQQPSPAQVVMAAGPGGVLQQYTLLGAPAGGDGGLQMLAPPLGVAGGPPPPQQQQQQLVMPGGGGGGLMQPAPAVMPVAPAPVAAPAQLPPGVDPAWAAGRRSYGAEQVQLGVRVGEFHELSPWAVFVHPSTALKLQTLWDGGNELVSMLDDSVWQALAELPAPEALAVVQEGADALDRAPGGSVGNINALLMGAVHRLTPGGRHPSGNLAAGRGYQQHHSTGAGRPQQPPQQQQQQPKQHAGRGTCALHMLPPELAQQARELIALHAPAMREEHMDEGVCSGLLRMAPADASALLDELAGNSLAAVRNVSGYLMGVLRRWGIFDKDNKAR